MAWNPYYCNAAIKSMQAYVLLKCHTGAETSLISELKKIPGVAEVNGIWGRYDIFLKVCSNEPEEIDRIVGQIRTKSDVTESYTMHVLYGQGGTIDE